MKTKERQCSATKADGARCCTVALPNRESCLFHDPDRAAERSAGRSLGGSRNRVKILGDGVPDVTIQDCGDVVRLIVVTINQVRKGAIDPRLANSVGFLANVAIRALDQGEMERRLAEIEAVVRNSRPSVSAETQWQA